MFDGGRHFRPIICVVGEAWQSPTVYAVAVAVAVVVVRGEETMSFDGPISSPRGDING